MIPDYAQRYSYEITPDPFADSQTGKPLTFLPFFDRLSSVNATHIIQVPFNKLLPTTNKETP